MKSETSMIFSLVLFGLFGLGLAGSARPARAVDMIGFTKRQDQWIGGAALHATGCPKELQDCGNDKAQSWCCPKDSTCKLDYCCPNDDACAAVVKTFPSCADPTWTLCSWEYYFGPEYYCCRPGEQCYMAVGGNAPACGPANLPSQSSIQVSTVSPSYTRGASGSVAPSVSSQSTPSSSSSSSHSSSSSSSRSSTTLVSTSNTQVIPSITRGSSGSAATSGSTHATAAPGGAQTPGSSTSSGSSSSPSSSSSGLSGGAIGGIVAGVLVGLGLIALVGILGARYGTRKAMESHTAEPPVYVAPVYVAPEGEQVYKPEAGGMPVSGGYRPPGDHVELGADGYRG